MDGSRQLFKLCLCLPRLSVRLEGTNCAPYCDGRRLSNMCIVLRPVLGSSAGFQKATISFVMSVRPRWTT